MFTHLYICLPLFTHVNPFLLVFTYVYPYLLVFIYDYSDLPLFTPFCACLPMFTLVYLCLPLITRVCLCLLVFTYVYNCLLVLFYLSLTMFTRVYICLPLFTHVTLSLYTASWYWVSVWVINMANLLPTTAGEGTMAVSSRQELPGLHSLPAFVFSIAPWESDSIGGWQSLWLSSSPGGTHLLPLQMDLAANWSSSGTHWWVWKQICPLPVTHKVCWFFGTLSGLGSNPFCPSWTSNPCLLPGSLHQVDSLSLNVNIPLQAPHP